MKIDSRILITGGTGLVGSSLRSCLDAKGYKNVLAVGSKDCNLVKTDDAVSFFLEYKPEYVFHCAACVFGIMGNMKNKGISFYNNTMVNMSVIEASRICKVKKIVSMGSGCVYPYPSPGIPLDESMIWNGKPHASEDSYAHSKRAMLAQLIAYNESYGLDYAFVVSANLYGPNDKFDVNFGHVTPSLIKKFYDAKQSGSDVTIWGDGSSERDFMYSADAAEALINIMLHLQGPVNMGSGNVSSIKDVVNSLVKITNFQNKVIWDKSKPNGQEYRSYDLSKLFSTGFSPKISLSDGLSLTYDWFENNLNTFRR